MTLLTDLARPTDLPLLIAFGDLTRFTQVCRGMSDEAVARFCQEYYTTSSHHLASRGGHVIKFIGDAVLVVFPESLAEAGILALRELKERVDDCMSTQGQPCRLVIKVHFGTAMIGPYGPEDRTWFDVLGSNVNLTATLPSAGFAMTAQAFRTLSPETRKQFKKHTPPITYIPREQSHGAVPC